MTAIALGGLGIVGGLLGLAFWILLIALIVALVRAPGRSGARVLEERYARGEITREEFLERRAVLGGG